MVQRFHRDKATYQIPWSAEGFLHGLTILVNSLTFSNQFFEGQKNKTKQKQKQKQKQNKTKTKQQKKKQKQKQKQKTGFYMFLAETKRLPIENRACRITGFFTFLSPNRPIAKFRVIHLTFTHTFFFEFFPECPKNDTNG